MKKLLIIDLNKVEEFCGTLENVQMNGLSFVDFEGDEFSVPYSLFEFKDDVVGVECFDSVNGEYCKYCIS